METVAAIKALNEMVDGCFFWAYTPVPDDFKPRHAASRHYRYMLNDAYSKGGFKRMIEAGAEFLGEHDFKAFSTKDRSEPDRGTIREITDIRLHRDGKLIQIDIVSRSFLWHQVRKMVWTLDQVGRGKMGKSNVGDLLAGKATRTEIGLAPAEGLILIDVSYEGLRFIKAAGPWPKALARRRASLESELAFIALASGYAKGNKKKERRANSA
jgi:tRNA pseudouridine(38-40) synthase